MHSLKFLPLEYNVNRTGPLAQFVWSSFDRKWTRTCSLEIWRPTWLCLLGNRHRETPVAQVQLPGQRFVFWSLSCRTYIKSHYVSRCVLKHKHKHHTYLEAICGLSKNECVFALIWRYKASDDGGFSHCRSKGIFPSIGLARLSIRSHNWQLLSLPFSAICPID